jgi:hypothetical protein
MQDKFKKLVGHQVDKFFVLAQRLQLIVETKFGGAASFHGSVDHKWNIAKWFGVLLQLANVEETGEDSHCWISELRTGEKGHPIITK